MVYGKRILFTPYEKFKSVLGVQPAVPPAYMISALNALCAAHDYIICACLYMRLLSTPLHSLHPTGLLMTDRLSRLILTSSGSAVVAARRPCCASWM